MTYGHAWLIWRILALLLIATYCTAGTIGMFADVGSTRDTILWIGFLLGGAALLVVGLWTYRFSPPTSAGFVSVGAAAGGFPLFWTLFVPLAAAVLIALAFSLARRPAAPA
jgi:hypothetical protein